MLVGVPLPICSCGVLPIATGLRRNGAGKGATVASLIGRKAAAAYVATIIAGAILCGCAVNFFTDAATATETARCASHGLTAVHWTCAAFLVAMLAYNLIRPVKMASAKHVCK